MTARARQLRLPVATSYAPDLRVVQEQAVALRPRPAVGAWLVLAIVVVAAFFVLIWSRIALDRTAFTLDEVNRGIATEEARYWELRLQITQLQSPDRIRDLAQEMGMVYPATIKTIEVPALGTPVRDVEDRWADLKALLGAQP